MVVNFILFYFFVFFIFIHGIFFNKFYCRFVGIKDFNNNFFIGIFFGLFSLSFISLLFNFFSNLNNIFFKFFIIFLFILSFVNIELKIYKNFFKNTLLILLISPLLNFMPAGYDAALYHFPHQTWIREEKIVFGLSNIQDRFGLISLYNYLGANLWLNDTFGALPYLQGTYYLLFFSFFIFILNLKIRSSLWIILSTVLTLPIWFRYVEPSYGLVDAPYGFLFYIVIILGLILLRDDKIDKGLINLFLIATCFSFTLKPSGVLVFPYTFLILIILLRNNFFFISNKIYLKIFLFSSFIIIAWIIKNIINTGCIVYPIQILCFDLVWSDLDQVFKINQAIKDFSYQYYKYVNLIYLKNFLFSFWHLLLFLIFSIIFLFMLYFKIKLTKFKNTRFIILTCLTLFALYLYSAGSLKGFAYLSQLNAEYTTITILREFFILSSIFLCSILLTSIFLNKETAFFTINSFIFFIPLLYLIFCFIVWILNAPSPRFAFGYFASLTPTIILAFVKNNFLYNSKSDNLIRNYIYFIVFILFFVEPIYKNKNNLDLNIRVIPKIETIKREGFGVRVDNFCWTEKNCYFYTYDLKLNYLLFNYKIFTK
jgi:hypothetical protein